MRYGMSARTVAALALFTAASMTAGPAASAAPTASPTAYLMIGGGGFGSKQFVLPIDTATGKPGTEIPIGKSGTFGTIVATPTGRPCTRSTRSASRRSAPRPTRWSR